MKVEKFGEIEAWQEAQRLPRLIYSRTHASDFLKAFSLRGRVQRHPISTVANIAEELGRQSNPGGTRFLSYAAVPAAELQSHLYVALDQGYIDQHISAETYSQATKMYRPINAFMTYLCSPQRSKRASK